MKSGQDNIIAKNLLVGNTCSNCVFSLIMGRAFNSTDLIMCSNHKVSEMASIFLGLRGDKFSSLDEKGTCKYWEKC